MHVQTSQETMSSHVTQAHDWRPTPEHSHDWRTESSHRTADGVLRYVRCHGCSARRVELQPLASAQAPISRVCGTPGVQQGAGSARVA